MIVPIVTIRVVLRKGVSDVLWDGVPYSCVLLCGVVYVLCVCSGCVVFVGWDIVVALLGVSGWVFVNVAYWGVGVVVFWSVELSIQVDEWVHFCAYS